MNIDRRVHTYWKQFGCELSKLEADAVYRSAHIAAMFTDPNDWSGAHFCVVYLHRMRTLSGPPGWCSQPLGLRLGIHQSLRPAPYASEIWTTAIEEHREWASQSERRPAGALVERYVALPGGILLTHRYTGTGGDIWAVPDIHGDIVATTDATGALMISTALYDPFGQPIDPASGTVTPAAVPTTRTNGPTDAWEGQHQRGYENHNGLNATWMGARTYLPALGQFTATDPVRGGNPNPQTYPNDPINDSDLTGQCKDHTVSCVMRILTSFEPYPPGFINFENKRGGAPRFQWTRAGWRALKTGGDHCSKSPDSGWAWNFKNACDTHDLGYELMRFMKVGGAIRRAVDGLFLHDMNADCAPRSFFNRAACRSVAYKYYTVVAGISWATGYGVP